MARIYKMGEQIPVHIDELTIKISPLSLDQKTVCQSLIESGSYGQSVAFALKHCLKSISGIENSDGSPYALDIEDNQVSDNCIDELLNIEASEKMQLVAMSLLKGIPKEFVNPLTNEPIEGVSFTELSKRKKPKK